MSSVALPPSSLEKKLTKKQIQQPTATTRNKQTKLNTQWIHSRPGAPQVLILRELNHLAKLFKVS